MYSTPLFVHESSRTRKNATPDDRFPTDAHTISCPVLQFGPNISSVTWSTKKKFAEIIQIDRLPATESTLFSEKMSRGKIEDPEESGDRIEIRRRNGSEPSGTALRGQHKYVLPPLVESNTAQCSVCFLPFGLHLILWQKGGGWYPASGRLTL